MGIFEQTIREALTEAVKTKLKSKPAFFGKKRNVEEIVDDMLKQYAKDEAFKIMCRSSLTV